MRRSVQNAVDLARRRWMGAGAAAALSACGAPVLFPPGPSCAGTEWVYAGTDGRGLRAFRFDPCEGTLAPAGEVADLVKPRWVASHPTLPVVYVAVDGNGAEGRVAVYRADAGSGVLALLHDMGSGGAGATHLQLDEAARTLLVANFGGGSVSSFPVGADGRLGERVSTLRATGSGPHRRQASAHAHGIAVAPGGRFALVADLGADRVFVHGLRPERGELVSAAAHVPGAFVAPPGSGPRRAVFGASGRQVYVLCELNAQIWVLNWDGATGRLDPVQALALSRPEYQGAHSASELALSPDGRFVYAADRGESMLVVFRVDGPSGTLALEQRISSGGAVPWAFAQHSSGRWLLVANHGTNRLQVFARDAHTGRLAPTPHFAESPGPVSVAFWPG